MLARGGHRAARPRTRGGDAGPAASRPEAGYAARLAPAVELLSGADGPVVIVGHSLGSNYAAVLATEVDDPSVVHLCPRLGGFTTPPGAPSRIRPGFSWPPADERGGMTWDPEAAATEMYGRLDPALARALAARLRPMAPPPEPFPLERHPAVPTAVVYAAEDEAFEPELIRFMARERLGVEPVELPGGHFPMIEVPGRLTSILDGLVSRRSGTDAAWTR